MIVIASASEAIQCERKLQIRPRACPAPHGAGRRHHTFLHIDLDAFFASVEQVKNPRLKGKPVIVGGRNSRRGVVAAASYEAKRFGIETGMPWPQAKQKCPQAIFLPADFDAYADFSQQVQKILEKMAPVVAPASIDEATIDLVDCERIYGTSRQAAEKMHQAIYQKTGLRSSIGIAASQSVAKIASKMAKPAGMMEVPSGEEANFLSALPVEAMPGIGSKIGERLRGMGILTLGELAKLPPALLRASFGVYGPFLRAKARGEDTWELEVTEVVKSIGKQKTLEKDVVDLALVQKELFELVELVGKKLRKENLYARGIAVHIRYSDFTAEGTSKTLNDPTCFDRILFRYASELISPLVKGKPIRLVGFTAQNLVPKEPQLDLFRTPKAARWERFYKGVDRVRDRFGNTAAVIASPAIGGTKQSS